MRRLVTDAVLARRDAQIERGGWCLIRWSDAAELSGPLGSDRRFLLTWPSKADAEAAAPSPCGRFRYVATPLAALRFDLIETQPYAERDRVVFSGSLEDCQQRMYDRMTEATDSRTTHSIEVELVDKSWKPAAAPVVSRLLPSFTTVIR